MAEFQEVVRQIKRMCDSHGASCHGCTLKEKSGLCTLVHDDEFIPEDWEEIKAAEIEMVVMHWAANNPEPRYPTWNEWYKATFPNSNYHTVPCPSMFYKICETSNYHGEVECYECKNQPIPADIAEKLGIKPIGGVSDENA